MEYFASARDPVCSHTNPGRCGRPVDSPASSSASLPGLFIGGPALELFYRRWSAAEVALVAGGTMAACWLFTSLFYHGIEEPARRWLRGSRLQRG